MFDYSDRNAEKTWNSVLEIVGIVFTWIFVLEFLIKVIAFGFFVHHKAYLRDGWNWIDFIVVIVGVMENIPGMPNMKALRTLRVLRPLKSVKVIPSMKRHITSLLASISPLVNVVAFLGFIFILFGILGVQNFAYSLYNKCRLTEEPQFDGSDKVWPIDFS